MSGRRAAIAPARGAAIAPARRGLGLGAAVLALGGAFLSGACAEPGDRVPPFPGDGVAGFGKAALVEVCVGTARAVPGGAFAVCVPQGVGSKECSADDECARPERCLCGRCIVNACSAGTVCPPGEACRGGRCTAACTEDSQCAPGEICNGGGCARACEVDSRCVRGEVCDFFGACAAKACSAQVACGSGHACEPLAIDGDVREPAVAAIAGEPVAFFELRSGSGSAVYRARFEGPGKLVADPVTPVLSPPPGAARVGAPSVIPREGRVDLFVAVGDGASIGLALSGDQGRSFTWSEEAALAPERPWEGGFVGSPGAFERDGETFVFYEGGPGRGVGLARATAKGLSRVSDEPLLVPEDLEDASFWRAVQSIGTPFAIVSGDIVRVYVTARGIELGAATTQAGPVPAEPNDSIGLFATRDLQTFDRYPTGPVFSTISGLFGARGEREPAVYLTDEGAELYFVATSASGSASAGLSRASSVR